MTAIAAIRPARVQDAVALAELVNLAGEGLPLYLWTQMVKDGGDPWAIGRGRARREEGSFSYRNATVIERDGTIAACLIGYPPADEPEPIDADVPAMFVPLQELESLAPGTWYVNALACFPQWRGQGIATELLKHAETLAQNAGVRNGMSVIVADSNVGARRLYERVGYWQIAERPMVKKDWDGPGETWMLLTKRL